MDYLVQDEQLTVKQACSCVALSRASYYRKPIDKAIKDAPVIDVLNAMIAKHGRWGFGLSFDWLRNQGYPWNHKRVWRIHKEMKLNMPSVGWRMILYCFAQQFAQKTFPELALIDSFGLCKVLGH